MHRRYKRQNYKISSKGILIHLENILFSPVIYRYVTCLNNCWVLWHQLPWIRSFKYNSCIMHGLQGARNMFAERLQLTSQAPLLGEKHGWTRKRESKLQNLWWQKSKYIKLRWGSLLELELYDQTKCLSFLSKVSQWTALKPFQKAVEKMQTSCTPFVTLRK